MSEGIGRRIDVASELMRMSPMKTTPTRCGGGVRFRVARCSAPA
jgi:hypothetical protein